MGMLVMVGASLPAVTVSTNISLAVNPPASVTVIVIFDVPVWFAAGVIVKVRLTPVPPKTIFAFGTKVKLDETADMVKLPAAVSRSPTVTATFERAVSSMVDLSVTLEIVGASLTALTVKINVSVVIPPFPSVTAIEIVATPF